VAKCPEEVVERGGDNGVKKREAGSDGLGNPGGLKRQTFKAERKTGLPKRRNTENEGGRAG